VPGEFHYVECESCGTVYQNPRVVDRDLERCYPAAYFTKTPPASTHAVRTPPAAIRALREAILLAADGGRAPDLSPAWTTLGRLFALSSRLRRRARFGLIDGLGCPRGTSDRCLEVGPGQGLDLRSLRSLGWQAVGLDADPAAATTASSVSGCEVRVGTLLTAEFPREHFALIYMNHVLEHLAHIRDSLRRCLDLLSDSGRLVMVLPNPKALTALRYGLHSCVWDPPRHLVLPSHAAITTLLKDVGFTQVRTHTTPRRAAAFHQAARRYRTSRRADVHEEQAVERLTAGDRAFALVETALERLGMPVGEEIVVRAEKHARACV
jgi:2-polyprenyl-3-methyl-5-hydroxy-6-metoxy-1,4-benzoquinol methylase